MTAAQTDERTQWLLDHFVKAWENADVEGLVSLLKEDAAFAMPPSPSWYQGKDAIRAFSALTIFGDDGMFPGKANGRWRLIPTNANNSPAFAIYQHISDKKYQAFGLIGLVITDGSLELIVSFIDPSLPTQFGLSQTLV